MRKDGLTIGVVGDELSVCKVLSRLITSAGFNVITYGSAQALLDGDYCDEPDLLGAIHKGLDLNYT